MTCSPTNTVYEGASNFLCQHESALPFTGANVLLIVLVGLLLLAGGILLARATSA